MDERRLRNPTDNCGTKNKILSEATRLFAMKGFGAVSIRDIGKVVGIKSSSIYSHYANKEALLEDVLSHFEAAYMDYFHWLTTENQKADSLEKVMDNMFVELINLREISTYYGMALALKEQFSHESARKRVCKLFYIDSVHFIQCDFDRLVEKKIIPPCNTKMIATVFMNSVLIGSEMRIHETMNHDIAIDVSELNMNLKRFITSMLENGI